MISILYVGLDLRGGAEHQLNLLNENLPLSRLVGFAEVRNFFWVILKSNTVLVWGDDALYKFAPYIFLFKALGKNIILRENSFRYLRDETFNYSLIDRILRWVLYGLLVRKIVVQSVHGIEGYSRYYKNYKLKYNHNFFQCDGLNVAKISRKKILFIGQFIPFKGSEYFKAIVAKFSDKYSFKAVVKSISTEDHEFLENHGVEVINSHIDKSDLYSDVACYINLSKSEGMSNSIMDASIRHINVLTLDNTPSLIDLLKICPKLEVCDDVTMLMDKLEQVMSMGNGNQGDLSLQNFSAWNSEVTIRWKNLLVGNEDIWSK